MSCVEMKRATAHYTIPTTVVAYRGFSFRIGSLNMR